MKILRKIALSVITAFLLLGFSWIIAVNVIGWVLEPDASENRVSEHVIIIAVGLDNIQYSEILTGQPAALNGITDKSPNNRKSLKTADIFNACYNANMRSAAIGVPMTAYGQAYYNYPAGDPYKGGALPFVIDADARFFLSKKQGRDFFNLTLACDTIERYRPNLLIAAFETLPDLNRLKAAAKNAGISATWMIITQKTVEISGQGITEEISGAAFIDIAPTTAVMLEMAFFPCEGRNLYTGNYE